VYGIREVGKMFSAREIYDIAIRLEENSLRLYREALSHVSDEALRDILQWLADEEESHRSRFVEMKNKVKSESDDLWADQMSTAILQGAVQHHAFSLEEADFASVEDETQLLKVAIDFEQDGILFYEIIRSFVTDPGTLGHIDEIIAEERKHVELFQEIRRTMPVLSARR
jgi:rubrerythrin